VPPGTDELDGVIRWQPKKNGKKKTPPTWTRSGRDGMRI
jgi:hypothetical protein